LAPSTGTPHIQGYIALKEPKERYTWSSLHWPPKIHWDVARASKHKNRNYCFKDGEFITNIPEEKRRVIKPVTLWKQWHFDLEKRLRQEPNDRSIYWVWSEAGKTGKTSFVKHMLDTGNTVVINKGKYSDMMNQMFNIPYDPTDAVYPDTVLVDIPRSMRRISYAALEAIKSGIITNSKYETGTKRIPDVHIVVFANFPPDKKNRDISSDVIIEINVDEYKSNPAGAGATHVFGLPAAREDAVPEINRQLADCDLTIAPCIQPQPERTE